MKTLYRQFIVTTILIMAFSSLAGYMITNTYYNLVTKEQNDAKNISIAEDITQFIENTDNLDLQRYFSTLGDMGYKLYIAAESGDAQFFGGEFHNKELSEKIVSDVMNGEVFHGMRDFPDSSFMTSFFANELKNSVGVPFTYEGENYALFLRPDIDLLFSEVHTIIMTLFFSMAVISLIAMLFVAKQLINPITQLTAATKQISRGKFDHLLKINRYDEIGQLAESFNEMTKQLRENDQSRKEFISNVSHDFQSPLLNIQGYAELLKSPQLTEEERLSFTSIIETETKRLSNLTKQLLILTSLDQSTRRLKCNSFSLDQQIKSLSHKYLWLIEEEGLELYYKMSPIMFYGDEDLLETAWDNLFTNALKYNKQNGSIQITLKEQEHHITVEFQDNGIGLRENEITHLFDRFYRADSSRTKEGTGLGLAIVKEIIELHGGEISVSSEFGVGTTFTVGLPKNERNI